MERVDRKGGGSAVSVVTEGEREYPGRPDSGGNGSEGCRSPAGAQPGIPLEINTDLNHREIRQCAPAPFDSLSRAHWAAKTAPRTLIHWSDMPRIVAVATANPPYKLQQAEIRERVAEHFRFHIRRIDRLLGVFDNAGIDERYFARPVEWLGGARTLRCRRRRTRERSVRESNPLVSRSCARLNPMRLPMYGKRCRWLHRVPRSSPPEPGGA